MVVSQQLDTFFTEKMQEYPTRRSFLVPMLLYTQDELGFLSDEAISYLAQKVDLTELEIRNVISYYSMLTTKPRGKYNVQVCRNICCMLRGSDEISAHVKQRLGISHKGTLLTRLLVPAAAVHSCPVSGIITEHWQIPCSSRVLHNS